jgi:UTP--glucose-1-phosphate uridylyltransferase
MALNPAIASTPRALVRKAVIPAGGFGTRFLPAAKAVPKELLPILGRPVIDYVVAEAIDAGCTEICIVLRHGKESIQRLFEPAPDLESRLSNPARSKDLDLVQKPGRGANIYYVYQPEAAGLGDAVLQARLFAGDDPFLVLAGDTILEPNAASHLVTAYEGSAGSAVAVEHVHDELVSRYGIVSPAVRIGSDDATVQSEPFHVDHLVEKPAPEESPSNYAISARYLFTSAIWPLLAATGPGRGGEIQLTDAMDQLARADQPGGGMMAVPSPVNDTIWEIPLIFSRLKSSSPGSSFRTRNFYGSDCRQRR